MSEGISNASLIAAAFGPGAVRRARPALGPAYARDPSALQPVAPTAYPRPEDRVDITGATEPASEANRPATAYDAQGRPTTRPADAQDPASGATGPAEAELSNEEQQQVTELKERDREVRRHEHAHIAAGGQYVRGSARFEYETGPDGKRYATGGEVSIDTSEVADDPAATIRKMQAIRRAALAPAEPSATDQRIASEAQAKENKARVELQERSGEKTDAPDAPTPDQASGNAETDAGPSPQPVTNELTADADKEEPSGVKALFDHTEAKPAPDRKDREVSPREGRDTEVPRIRQPGPRYASLDAVGGVLDLVG